ncbi:MAG: tetratricopeptide repeat protein [Gammaproteobacteria bacterium]|nr:tetratricopeptide repeat protein [Gammaproteobacteria bacterium]
MTFGRWLLIHSFSIFLVVLLILGYVYREELQLEQAYQQLLNIEPDKLTFDREPESAAVIPEQPESIPTLEQQPAAVEEPAPLIFAEPAPEPAIMPPTVSSVPTFAEPVFAQNERLFQARRAYWNKNYNQAIEMYRQLIEQDPSNPDYYGELGNIYYALNDDENASTAFYQAALILLEQNQLQSAARLLSPINAMNRSLGDQLNRRLREKSAQLR